MRTPKKFDPNLARAIAEEMVMLVRDTYRDGVVAEVMRNYNAFLGKLDDTRQELFALCNVYQDVAVQLAAIEKRLVTRKKSRKIKPKKKIHRKIVRRKKRR